MPHAPFTPLQFLQRSWRYFDGCRKHRQAIKKLLEDPELLHDCAKEEHRRHIKKLLRDPELLHRCSDEREKLSLFFASKLDLSRLAFDMGTIVVPDECVLLQEIVERSNALPGPIIEIGTLFGETTTRIATWKAPHKKVVTVDNYSWNPWNVSPLTHVSLTQKVLKYLTETGHVEVRSCDKNAFYAEYRGERPSMVFLDADHSYEATKADIAWAQRVGALIISGHDYGDSFSGVGRAVVEAGGAVRHVEGLWALNGPYWETAAGKTPWMPARAKAA